MALLVPLHIHCVPGEFLAQIQEECHDTERPHDLVPGILHCHGPQDEGDGDRSGNHQVAGQPGSFVTPVIKEPDDPEDPADDQGRNAEEKAADNPEKAVATASTIASGRLMAPEGKGRSGALIRSTS